MRILFTRFPLESALGGAEIQTLSLMKGLKEKGHAVAFLGSCPVMLEHTATLQLPHAKLEIGPPPVTKWGAISFTWRKQKMKQQLEDALSAFHDLEAVVMLSLSEKLLMTEAAVQKGIKVFWLEHDRVGPWLSKNPWLSKLRALSSSVTTICVSELSRRIYLGLGWEPEKVIAIPNGIDANRFALTGAREQRTEDRNLYVGCVSRLSQEKGVDVLMQAARDIPQVDLTIVGSGPEEGYLRKLMQSTHDHEMSGAERMRIVSKVNDLGDFYRSVDALVLPSRDNDPFGLVAAEAMSVGTPVIVTDQCGIADYLTDGKDAVVVEANSDVALRGGMERMMDPEMRSRLSTEGRATAEREFSLAKMISRYEKLL